MMHEVFVCSVSDCVSVSILSIRMCFSSGCEFLRQGKSGAGTTKSSASTTSANYSLVLTLAQTQYVFIRACVSKDKED